MSTTIQEVNGEITTRLDAVEKDLTLMLYKLKNGYYSPFFTENRNESSHIGKSGMTPTTSGSIQSFLEAFANQTSLEFPELGASEFFSKEENSFETSTPFPGDDFDKTRQTFFQNNALLTIPTTTVSNTQASVMLTSNYQCERNVRVTEKPRIASLLISTNSSISLVESNSSIVSQYTKAGKLRKPRGRPKNVSPETKQVQTRQQPVKCTPRQTNIKTKQHNSNAKKSNSRPRKDDNKNLKAHCPNTGSNESIQETVEYPSNVQSQSRVICSPNEFKSMPIISDIKTPTNKVDGEACPIVKSNNCSNLRECSGIFDTCGMDIDRELLDMVDSLENLTEDYDVNDMTNMESWPNTIISRYIEDPAITDMEFEKFI